MKIINVIFIFVAGFGCSTSEPVPSVWHDSGELQTGSGDFVEFFQERIAAIGAAEAIPKDYDFPPVNWGFRSDANGFEAVVKGVTFEQVIEFAENLYGEPRAELDEPDYSHRVYAGGKLALQVFTRDDGGVQILGVRRFDRVKEIESGKGE